MKDKTDTPNSQNNPSSDARSLDYERLARLSAELQELFVAASSSQTESLLSPEPLMEASRKLFEALQAHPDKMAGAQADLTRRLLAVLQEITEQTPAEHLDTDARFSDAAWQDNSFFDLLRRTYAAISDWALALPETTPDLSSTDRAAIKFYINQASAALSPSNFVASNPKVLSKIMQSGGDSLAAGLEHAKTDFDQAANRWNITQSDTSGLTIGENLATTPGKVVHKNDLIELIRYTPTTDTVYERPLLIFPPWINKYYVLDLTARNSFVAWCRDQGFTVYIVSWRNADKVTADYTGEDYIRNGGLEALEFVNSVHNQPVNLVGYCIGGTMLAIMAAYLCRQHDERISALTFLAAQTDFSEPGDLGVIVTPQTCDALKKHIADHDGIMRGELMADAFNMLRPQELIWRYVENNYLMGETPREFDLLYWNADQTNIPGPLHISYLRQFYLENALATGRLEVADEPVRLSDIHTPVFIQASERDHISPAASVFRGARLFGGDVEFLLAESGHIAGVVNPPVQEKYGYWKSGNMKAGRLALWQADAKKEKGSWWPHWAGWLQERSGQKTKPLPMPKGLGDAPGDYVKVRLEDILFSVFYSDR